MTPAEHAKAKAQAKALEKANAEAEAKAAILNRRRPQMTAPVVRAEKPVPSPQPGRLSPAAQRKAYLVASGPAAILAASGLSDDDAQLDDINLSSDVAKIVLQLQADRRALKEIKATERKVAAKVSMLPAYTGWCDGILAGGGGERGPLDQIFTTIMAWTIDVGDYIRAMPMLEHVIVHKLDMPAGFSRDPLTFAIDQICEDAIRVYDLGGEPAQAFPAAVLPMLQDMAEDHDIDLHDEVEAKLHKALGLAIMAGANLDDEADLRQRREQTLKAYMRAFEIFPRIGVKKDIERLQRELRKGQPEATNDQSSALSDQPDQTETSENNTPPSDG